MKGKTMRKIQRTSPGVVLKNAVTGGTNTATEAMTMVSKIWTMRIDKILRINAHRSSGLSTIAGQSGSVTADSSSSNFFCGWFPISPSSGFCYLKPLEMISMHQCEAPSLKQSRRWWEFYITKLVNYHVPQLGTLTDNLRAWAMGLRSLYIVCMAAKLFIYINHLHFSEKKFI